MWLITPIGFFSVVQKPGEDRLTVRARVKEDLESLRKNYLSELSDVVSTPNNDYGYRAFCSHAEFSGAMQKITHDINYSNFKRQVKKVQGKERAGIYGTVWGDLWELKYLEVQDDISKLGYSTHES